MNGDIQKSEYTILILLSYISKIITLDNNLLKVKNPGTVLITKKNLILCKQQQKRFCCCLIFICDYNFVRIRKLSSSSSSVFIKPFITKY